jgi:regulator of protease activity HflC (stomatin/prohibitin superfamily)
LQDALAEAQNDLFDAYLYSLYHPCDISPHELIALINAHLDVMAAQKEARREALRADIEAKKEALWLEVERKLLAKAKKQRVR